MILKNFSISLLLTTLLLNVQVQDIEAFEPVYKIVQDKNNQSTNDEEIIKSIPIVEIKIPKTFKQGDTVFVTVKSDNKLINPRISFSGVVSNLFEIGEGLYRGLIGTEAVTKAGGYTLHILDDSGLLNHKKKVELIPGKFRIQNIRISGRKSSLTATEDELEKVGNAKKLISSKSYWDNLPFTKPTKGSYISPYGVLRYHNGKSTGDFHKGLDIKAPNGQDIVSNAAGKVIIAENFRLHGGTVAVDHGQGVMSIYIHMSKINVKPGDVVKQGQKIGEVGSTGFATGPHLHWGLYVNGKAINPLGWIK